MCGIILQIRLILIADICNSGFTGWLGGVVASNKDVGVPRALWVWCLSSIYTTNPPSPRASCQVTYHMIPIAQLNTTPYNNIWHPATKYNIESDLHPRFTQTLPLSLCHVPYQPNQQTISCIKVCNAYHNRTYHTMLCNTIQYPIWFTQPPPLSSCQPTI